MTKQTLYLNNLHKKEWIYIAISKAICLLNSPLLERSDDLSNEMQVLSVVICATLPPAVRDNPEYMIEYNLYSENTQGKLIKVVSDNRWSLRYTDPKDYLF